MWLGKDIALGVVQNKTKAKRTIEITGELKAVMDRINARPRERLSAFLIQDDDGRPLSVYALRSRFDKARKAACVAFQFRDIRAKAATDTGDLGPGALSEAAGSSELGDDRALRRAASGGAG